MVFMPSFAFSAHFIEAHEPVGILTFDQNGVLVPVETSLKGYEEPT